MREDLLFSMKEKLQSLTERVFPCFSHGCQGALPCGSLGWHHKLEQPQQRRAGGEISSAFWEENSQQVKGPKSPIRGLRCGEQEAHGEPPLAEGTAGMAGGAPRAHLAQLPQFVPGSSCILLLSRELLLLLLQLPFQDSNWVTLLRGLPAWDAHQWGPTPSEPSPPPHTHRGHPALCSRGKFSSLLPDTLRASLSENGVLPLPCTS